MREKKLRIKKISINREFYILIFVFNLAQDIKKEKINDNLLAIVAIFIH